jgi:hypothetical protein
MDHLINLLNQDPKPSISFQLETADYKAFETFMGEICLDAMQLILFLSLGKTVISLGKFIK